MSQADPKIDHTSAGGKARDNTYNSTQALLGHNDGFDGYRDTILARTLRDAPFDGFTPITLKRNYAAALREDPSVPGLPILFPAAIHDVLRYWSMKADMVSKTFLEEENSANLKIREKVTEAVWTRLDYLAPHKEAARRAAALLVLPPYASTGTTLLWQSSDVIWRAIGARDTDFNFYSKRTILAGVIASTMTFWYRDDSHDDEATRQFLEDRIENVMQFEKLKAQWKRSPVQPDTILKDTVLPFLSRLRYPRA